MKWTRATPLIFLLAVGCVTTRKDERKTGLFGDDLKKLSDAYEKVDRLGRGTTRGKIEELGFDFKFPNIERVPGYQAYKRIFTETVFQGAIRNPGDADKLTEEMNQYYAYFVPLRDVTTEIDRFYFTRKETHRTGDDLMIVMMFKKGAKPEEDTLCFNDYQYVKIDEKESESAFAQGFLDMLDKYGKFGSNVKDLIERLKDFVQKNKDEE